MIPPDKRNNRLRQLEGLVTVDAWHEHKSGTVDATLSAYVNFAEARLGGAADDAVAFRLQLKNAELRFLQSEPRSYSLDPAAIWRGDGNVTGTQVEKAERRNTSAGSNASKKKASLSKDYGAAAEFEKVRSFEDMGSDATEFTSQSSSRSIAVSFQRHDRSQPSWIFRALPNSPRVDGIPVLNGVPWDEEAKTLMRMRVNSRHLRDETTASLRMCIVCRSEDLLFHDMKVRDKRGNFVSVPIDSPRRLVVQEYLRQALTTEGLPSGDMNSPFSLIWLGEAISEMRRDY